MGVFFETQAAPSRAAVTAAIQQALETDPATVPDPADAAQNAVANLTPAAPATFHTGRFVGALLIFIAVAAAAVATDATDLGTSSAALWGFAGTIFGVVVGFFGSEKSSAS